MSFFRAALGAGAAGRRLARIRGKQEKQRQKRAKQAAVDRLRATVRRRSR
jgi:hypothetical protein